ncbi:lytic transglycosylase domain-containing protein [Paenibacillus sp. OV219]|uniref:lytic transglycosylase domain-containing protein n=1 Tax=Paenibacillus sp. OV219 TaxID=1884377 RepID=UPI0008BABD0D|nr:lytic transglycosylase domain-containing protein [Paenibacillus sp. OV219]SEN10409.1 Transglycosylase SLT domain-containing protein [Paenibacillus sp. OV219]
MSIDPRIMKSLLQLQLMPSLDLNGNDNVLSATSGTDGSSMFDSLLQQYMAGGAGMTTTDGLNGDISSSLGTLSLGALGGIAPMIANAEDIGNDSTGNKPTDYDSIINDAAAKYGIDPSLIKGVIHTESSFNPNAESSAGAKGLMQLMDGTARGLGVSDSFNPEQNIEGGTRFLAYLLRKYDGNVQSALAAYNAGPGRVDRSGITGSANFDDLAHLLPKETQRYVSKVLNQADKYSI